MSELRQHNIENFARKGDLPSLQEILSDCFTQLEIDLALEAAVAYSHIDVAEYLFSIGADFSNYNYQGVYYAVQNNELEGLKFAISKGIDININNGMLLNCCVFTATNSNSTIMFNWLLDNGAKLELLTSSSKEIIEKYGTDELKHLIKIKN